MIVSVVILINFHTVCICTFNVCFVLVYVCISIIFNMVEWQQISAELSKVNDTESQSTFSMACYICLCERVRARLSVHLHTCICVSLCLWVQLRSAAHQTFRSAVSPGCRFSTSGHGVSMCNNDYLHLNHKEQENPDNCNTVGNTPCSPPPMSRPWWNMAAGFAQLSAASAKSRHT